MRYYCYENGDEFVLCAENAGKKFKKSLEAAWFKKDAKRFIKIYKNISEDEKKLVSNNFARLGPAMFEKMTDWKTPLVSFARRCAEYNAGNPGDAIEWYITGSAVEAVSGADITPHDIDIIVHTKDFHKIKNLFSECVVEPFADNNGTWSVRYFGRICLGQGYLDIAADEKTNAENHRYDKTAFEGYDLFTEPLETRLRTETERKRKDRVKAIKAYLRKSKARESRR
jgi:hypothetical protein